MAHRTTNRTVRPAWLMSALIISLLAAIAVSIIMGIFLGSADLDAKTVIDVLRHKIVGTESADLKRSAISIVWELRLPRVLLAIVAGGGLAVAGAAMQAVTQNVMADPYILGASSGASAAVAFTFVIGGVFAQSGSVISIFAFTGAILALLLVYSVGMVGCAGSTSRLVLAGMAISVILTAATQFFISIAPDAYTVRNITAWTMGSLASARWSTIGFPCVGAIIGSIIFMYFSRAFNLLSQGDETAISLGLNVKSIKRLTIIVTAFITGAVVSVGGVYYPTYHSHSDRLRSSQSFSFVFPHGWLIPDVDGCFGSDDYRPKGIARWNFYSILRRTVFHLAFISKKPIREYVRQKIWIKK